MTNAHRLIAGFLCLMSARTLVLAAQNGGGVLVQRMFRTKFAPKVTRPSLCHSESSHRQR